MRCDQTDALLAARLDGTLEPDAAADLDAHLAECGDCRDLVGTLEPVFPVADDGVYDLGPVLAIGGMGQIRLARDLRTGRQVAIKELLVHTELMVARFVREARVAANLQHPNIVPIYEVGTWADGTPFYTMRPVQGRTLLRALTAATTLAERMQLLPSIIAAADAVAFAHSKGITHRDLSPANILLGEFGETVVIDWGLAKGLCVDHDYVSARFQTGKTQQVLTARGDVIGSPAYMPPEQAAGELTDERSDTYALGAILYHLLAGRAPYSGASRAVLEQVRSAAPVAIERIAPGAPRALAKIVATAMSRDRAERYASTQDFARALRQFQDDANRSLIRRVGSWFVRTKAA